MESVVVGGKSATLPRQGFMGTTGAFQQDFNYRMLLVDRERGFVAKLAGDGSRWLFVAPIGSSGGNLVRNAYASSDPAPTKVAVDAAGAIYVTGVTDIDRQLPVAAMDARVETYRNLQPIQSPGYFEDGATTVAYGPSAVFYGRGSFLMKLSPEGAFLTYSVIINSGVATGLALDLFGAAYVTGYRAGAPQVNATQSAPGSIFIAKVISQATSHDLHHKGSSRCDWRDLCSRLHGCGSQAARWRNRYVAKCAAEYCADSIPRSV